MKTSIQWGWPLTSRRRIIHEGSQGSLTPCLPAASSYHGNCPSALNISNVTIHPLDAIRNAGHKPAVIAFAGNRRAYVTLRGPKPAPTLPHASVGVTAGIAILDTADRKLLNVVKLGDQKLADFHGLFIPGSQ